MYIFISDAHCMVANPVKCHVYCSNYFAHISRLTAIACSLFFVKSEAPSAERRATTSQLPNGTQLSRSEARDLLQTALKPHLRTSTTNQLPMEHGHLVVPKLRERDLLNTGGPV